MSDSYSYSYSYSSYNEDEGYSYSDYGSYDYSDRQSGSADYSYSASKDATTEKSQYSDGDYYSYSYSDSDSKRDESSEYYDYSTSQGKSYSGAYSTYDTPTYTNTKTEDLSTAGKKPESSYYGYSGETSGSTMTYSGQSYSSGYYSDSKSQSKSYYSYSSQYYYSDQSYPYSEDYYNDSYYDEKSPSGYHTHSDYSPYSSYSSSSPSDYYSSSDYYYSSSSAHKRRIHKRPSVEVQSITRSLSSTTSSYSYESEDKTDVASHVVGATPTNRELVVLRTPTKEFPNVPSAPKRCFLREFSGEDMVHRFVHQLFLFQREYELQCLSKKVVPLSAEESSLHSKKNKSKEKKKKEEIKPEPTVVSLTPDGFFSQRSARIAFNCLGLTHLERREVLKNVPIPIPQLTLTNILNLCSAARVKETVAKRFLALDVSRRGELDLRVVCSTLRSLGIASSPVFGDIRINVDCVKLDGRETPCMSVEHRLENTEGEEGESWEVANIPVVNIVKRAVEKKTTTSVQLHNQVIYMGDEKLCRCGSDENVFQRLKTYIEAATYACVLTHVFTVYDADGHPKVLYPHLVRHLLLPQSMSSAETPSQRKIIYLENLFRTLCTPMEKLDAYATTQGIFMYAGRAAIESTLHGTQDSEEKKRRNVVPNTTEDLLRFDKRSVSRDTTVCFAIEKVRLPAELEEGTSCFCYVSTITPQNVFLPALKVPATSVRSSSKEGYTWTFKNKDQKHDLILFSGPKDRLYVEFCFQTPGCDTVWCAGYTVTDLEGLKSATFSVQQGSLMDQSPEDHKEVPKEEKEKKSSFFSKFKKSSKQKAPQTATTVKVRVEKVDERDIFPNGDQMPKRFLIKLRHVKLVSELRGAVMELGKESAYAGQALRHQVVKRIFSVASSEDLLDELVQFMKFKEKGYSKGEKDKEKTRLIDLLSGASSLAALHNCSTDAKQFSSSLTKAQPSYQAFSEDAPMLAVSI